MSDELVTIAEFETAFEAEAVKDCLEENDIKAVVVGENLSSVLPHITTIVGVEVKVFEKDAERAKAVLETYHTQCENVADSELNDSDETGEDA